MAKGRSKLITCEICHQRTPYHRAVSFYKWGRKIYVCADCAKRLRVHGKLPERGVRYATGDK